MVREKFRTFSVRLPESIYRRLQVIARAQRRSMGPQIVMVLDEKLAELEREQAAERGPLAGRKNRGKETA